MRRFVVILVLLPLGVFAQQPNLDSLWSVWEDESQLDSNRFDAIQVLSKHYVFNQPDSSYYYAQLYYELAKAKDLKQHMAKATTTQAVTYHMKSDFDKAKELYNKALGLFEGINDNSGITMCLNNLGSLHTTQGNYDMAIAALSRCLMIEEENADTNRISTILSNIAIIYENQGSYAKAIEFQTRSLQLDEKIQDKVGIAQSLSGIGNIYRSQGDNERALEFFFKSLELQQELGNRRAEATSMIQVGNAYSNMGDSVLALKYYDQGLNISRETQNLSGMATALNNKGLVYEHMERYDLALASYTESSDLFEQMGDRKSLGASLNNIGIIHREKGNYTQAISYGNKSLALLQEVGSISHIEEVARALVQSYKAVNDYPKALEMYELQIHMRDSVLSEENKKEIIRQEYKYEYEKKEAVADAEHTAELERQEAVAAEEQKKQNIIIGSVSGGLGLVVLFSIFLFNRFRVIHKQKGVIEEQKQEVDRAYDHLEEKNTEIMDSIQYARRIQSAILPPVGLVKKYLTESFILYKPKDIVAGDFYWLEHAEGMILFAAADCTGHGVPGAMVSVMCSNALTKAVKEAGITQPAAILDKAVEYLEQQFEKSEEDVKDGMDLALCSLDTKTNTLQYAGANNPLWIIPAGAKEIEDIKEVKADKQPVGKYDHRQPFTNHEVQLNAGDSIYIFSDGYPDQFGGPKGKKLKYKPFKQMLLDNRNKPMKEQSAILDTEFENWRGDLGQVDDVCVIGVRI